MGVLNMFVGNGLACFLKGKEEEKGVSMEKLSNVFIGNGFAYQELTRTLWGTARDLVPSTLSDGTVGFTLLSIPEDQMEKIRIMLMSVDKSKVEVFFDGQPVKFFGSTVSVPALVIKSKS